MTIIKSTIFIFLLALTNSRLCAQELYKIPNDTETRWASFENPTAGKGKGGAENKKAKGHPSDNIASGETKTLLDIKGAGVIQRIWLTINDRSPAMLRSLRLEIYWDES